MNNKSANIKKVVLSIAIIFIILMINLNIASAYCVGSDGAECHEPLTDKAIELIKSKDKNSDFDYKDIRDEIRYGLYEEDQPATQVRYHFLNPLNREGIPLFLNAEERSIDTTRPENWQNAINLYDYSLESKKNAYRYLGHIVHLEQDMSVPAHTHIDIHGPGAADDYETYVKNNAPSIISSIPLTTLAIKDLNNRTSYFYELANLSYYRNRYPANLSNTNNPQGNLTKLYPNQTFLKYNSIFSYWEIKDVGKWSGSDSVGFQDAWWETVHEAENKEHGTEIPGWYYIENTNPDTPSPPVKEKSKWYPDNPALDEYKYNNINEFSIARIYADQLLPLAVNYSAGLIQFYYSIVNHPPYVYSVKVSQFKNGVKTPRYEKHWQDPIGNYPYRTLIDDLSISEVKRGEGYVEIEIRFSEPVQKVIVNLGPNPVTGNLDSNKVIWVGQLTLDPANPSLDGEQTIEISATDLDKHFDNIGEALDPDPSTPARRTILDNNRLDEYQWNSYEYFRGYDKNHKIKIVTAPTTTHSLSGTKGINNWFRSSVIVTLSASGGQSGVMNTNYNIDSRNWQTYVGPFTISGEGVHTVYYYSTDYAGNKESQKNVSVNIDTGNPGAVYPYWPFDWTNDNTPKITWSAASDSLSGVAGYEYAIDQTSSWTDLGNVLSFNTPSLSDGQHFVNVKAYDFSLNRGEYGIVGVTIDATPPTNPNSYSSSHTKDEWSNDNTIDITWSGATDAHSGIDSYYYTWDILPSTVPGILDYHTSSTSTTSSPLPEGYYYFHVRTKDKTGNLNPEAYHVGPFILKMVNNKIYISCKIFDSFMSTLGVYNDSDKVYY